MTQQEPTNNYHLLSQKNQYGHTFAKIDLKLYGLSKCFLFLFIQLWSVGLFAQVTVSHLLTENRVNPIGISTPSPRFSWQLNSEKRNTLQTAYEVEVTNSLNKKMVWSSGKITSDSSVRVPYAGPVFQSGTRYNWKVRVWDNKGSASAWSEPAFFLTALLDLDNEGKAVWLAPGYKEDSVNRASPMFRKEFNSSKKIASAVLYITAHGLYEAKINGKRVGDAYLTPGWTSYHKRLQYQTYDITSMVKNGSNAIGVTLGSGWYRGIIGFSNSINVYGKDIALLAQMNITYTDGTSQIVATDNAWKSTTGAIRYAEIYNGETIDNRMDKKGWMMPGYDDKDWSGVTTPDYEYDNLITTDNEPVRKHETFAALKIITTPKGEKVLDFGQNLVGWVLMKVRGNSGDTVTLSHAEVLDKEGNFYTDNLREAKAQDKFILKGGEEETFEPHFTWHGFRYVKINGYPGDIKPENFTAFTLYSDMAPTGSFSTNNALINQLQHNIQWGQKGNFLDVPTDCPQRDERLGWTGDAQVFSRTASFNMNVNDFFAKWLKDVTADQVKGKVPFVIPNVLGEDAGGSTGWADVATIIPWNMYVAYGDKQILKDQYNSMKAWVDYMTTNSKNNLWQTGFHFGDWLFYRPEDDNDGRAALTDKYLIAQCFYAHSTQLLINTAKVLGNKEDEADYTSLLTNIKSAFAREYMTTNGRLVSGTQTAYVLALQFDMLPDSLQQQAAQRLAENVKSYDNHLTTGFLGTPYLCGVLSRFGYDTIAYKLLLQPTYPSWLYPVKMGATTIWERWDGIKPDSSFETPSMNSYNHYSYGAIGDWMYRVMVGLDTYEDGVGYKHIKIQPHISDSFSTASATLQTYYGKLSNSWTLDTTNHTLKMDVEIPANTTATVYIPAVNAEQVMESGKAIFKVSDIKISGTEKGYVVLNIGSGVYHFAVSKSNAASAKK